MPYSTKEKGWLSKADRHGIVDSKWSTPPILRTAIKTVGGSVCFATWRLRMNSEANSEIALRYCAIEPNGEMNGQITATKPTDHV